MTDKIAETPGILKGARWHYMNSETVAGYGPWVRAEDYEALARDLAAERDRAEKAEAERDANLEEVAKCIMSCRPGPEGFRTSPASAGVYKMRQALEAAEADRDRLAAELAEARELIIKMGDDLISEGTPT
jgi:hypothetical protein